jgi:hypothetical protein
MPLNAVHNPGNDLVSTLQGYLYFAVPQRDNRPIIGAYVGSATGLFVTLTARGVHGKDRDR